VDDSNPAGPEGRPLDPMSLESILLRATSAPSAHNLQPWRFLVVRDERNRRRLRSIARNRPEITRAPAVAVVLAYHFPDRTHLEPMLERAVEAGSCPSEKAAEIRGRVAAFGRRLDHQAWASRTAMLAASRLMLAAESLGVAATLIEEFDAEALRAEFGVPDDHSICCLIPLGHEPEPDPTPGRLGLDEVGFAEHFGQPWRA